MSQVLKSTFKFRILTPSNQSITGQENHTKYFDHIEKNIDCVGLFSNSDIDINSEFEYPPYKIPKWLVPEYNYGGRIPISYYYRDDSKNDNVKVLEDNFGNIHWTTNLTKWIEEKIRSNHFGGSIEIFPQKCLRKT